MEFRPFSRFRIDFFAGLCYHASGILLILWEAILKRTQNAEKRLVFLAWLLFATAILGRGAFSANINLIIEHYGVTRADAGMVNSFYFFAYGLGQVFHGFLCR